MCEDIVHVDPFSPTQSSLESSRVTTQKVRRPDTETRRVTEIYASTKPYASWWSEFEESKILRRRRSTGDAVLERNICLVDTPGREPNAAVQYAESQFFRCASASNNDSDMTNMLNGNGGPQVDAVFYLISGGT